ncbi:DUF6538 domain-containing protein [Tardiphaga sp. 71_E8_N1_1]|uniref:DUF6538 domain-containing protein n=1 Tax=Tardiphaga sp. 71_E8_N1_1 TaxID=3240784 RepID=UPI003F889B7D
MPRVTHLIRRNGVYWFRIDLPGDLAGRRLRPAVPDSLKHLESPKQPGRLKTAVWLSLRTTAEREAKTRVAQNVLRYEALFEGARAFGRRGVTAPGQQRGLRVMVSGYKIGDHVCIVDLLVRSDPRSRDRTPGFSPYTGSQPLESRQ